MEKQIEVPSLSMLELELAPGPQTCDSCSARAIWLVWLPYGKLSFCGHHYNQNAQALTEQGAIAKLLDEPKE
jgi:hypothetical protein